MDGSFHSRPGVFAWDRNDLASALLVVCAAATGYALSRLAVGGFAPAGELAAGPLVIYAAGMLALWLAGRSGTKAPA